jgi:hypothetical protein
VKFCVFHISNISFVIIPRSTYHATYPSGTGNHIRLLCQG